MFAPPSFPDPGARWRANLRGEYPFGALDASTPSPLAPARPLDALSGMDESAPHESLLVRLRTGRSTSASAPGEFGEGVYGGGDGDDGTGGGDGPSPRRDSSTATLASLWGSVSLGAAAGKENARPRLSTSSPKYASRPSKRKRRTESEDQVLGPPRGAKRARR